MADGPRGLLPILVVVLAGGLFGCRQANSGVVTEEERTLAMKDASYQLLDERPDRLIAVLPNRLVVVAQELSSAPVVTAQVWVRTGSIYEQEFVGAGLSHFLEHLASGGSTQRRTEVESNAVLGRIGARTNAATSLATVRYYINTTAAYAEDAIELLSDWMQHSQLSDDEFSRERDVIQREFQMGQGDPGRIFWKLTQKARYAYHPARHPTIGYLQDFLAITRDDLYAFYKRMYVPNNMIFVVVGDIDRRRIMEQVAAAWERTPATDLPAISFPIEPSVDAPRSLNGVADVTRPRIRLAWPGTRLAEEGDYALDLLAIILGQGESSRLVRQLRDEQRLVNTISAFNLSMNWGEGFFSVDAEIASRDGVTDEQASADVKAAVLALIQRVRRGSVTENELAQAKRKLMARQVYASQTAEGLAADLAENLISMNDPDYSDRYAELIQTVTADAIVGAAQRLLTPERLITVSLAPIPKGREPEVLHRPADMAIPANIPREEIDLDNAGLVAALAKGKRGNAGRQIVTQPTRRVVLPNGLRLLVGVNNAVPAVSMHFYHLGGLLADEPGREGVANATWRMLLRGTQTQSSQAIAERIENVGASMTTSCGYNTHYGQATCLKEDWADIFELFADVIQNPAFESAEWDRMQGRLLASISRINDRWTGELNTRFRHAYFGEGHAWSQTVAGRHAVVANLGVEDLRAFHRNHLGSREAVLAVFGDVDPQAVVQKARELFGGMAADPVIDFVAPPVGTLRTGLQAHATAKQLAAVQLGFGPGATRASKDYPGLRVLSNVISDFPSGWLNQALRGSEGLVYAAWAYAYTGLSPGYFTVVFNTGPQTLEPALGRAMDVMRRAREEPVDQVSLARAKAGVLTSEFFGRQTNGDRAQQAALGELYGIGLDEAERFLADVDGLTAEDLRALARKYFRHPVAVVMSHEPPYGKALQALRGIVLDFDGGMEAR